MAQHARQRGRHRSLSGTQADGVAERVADQHLDPRVAAQPTTHFRRQRLVVFTDEAGRGVVLHVHDDARPIHVAVRGQVHPREVRERVRVPLLPRLDTAVRADGVALDDPFQRPRQPLILLRGEPALQSQHLDPRVEPPNQRPLPLARHVLFVARRAPDARPIAELRGRIAAPMCSPPLVARCVGDLRQRHQLIPAQLAARRHLGDVGELLQPAGGRDLLHRMRTRDQRLRRDPGLGVQRAVVRTGLALVQHREHEQTLHSDRVLQRVQLPERDLQLLRRAPAQTRQQLGLIERLRRVPDPALIEHA